MTAPRPRTWVACLVAALVPVVATPAAASVHLTTTPALTPGFRLDTPDYVARCAAGAPLHFSVSATGGDKVAIGNGPKRGGSFTVDRTLATGAQVAVRVTAGGRGSTHHVRCLPQDFPTWTVHRRRTPESQWYVLTPVGRHSDGYVAVFDARGVPVWWMHSSWYAPWDGKLLESGNLIWARIFGTDFGLDPRGGWEEHALDGQTVRVLQTHGTPTDFHDLEREPDGNYLLDSYERRPGTVDLRKYGGPQDARVYDAVIQELTPEGELKWSWSSRGRIKLSENRWWRDIVDAQKKRPAAERRYDLVHINSMEADGDGIIASARFLDAVFRIDRATKRITWKLGGTHRPVSLKAEGALADSPFGGQHDARLYKDGTLTVYDNGASGRGQAYRRPPRAVRYRIDTGKGTAKLVEALAEKAVPRSGWGGGARKLAGGNWVVNWGGTNLMTERTATSGHVIEIEFGGDRWGYRAYPIEHGRISAQQLRKGMDAILAGGRSDVPQPSR